MTQQTRLGALAAWRALFRARRPVRPAGRLPEHIDALLVATQAPLVVEALLVDGLRATVRARAAALGITYRRAA